MNHFFSWFLRVFLALAGAFLVSKPAWGQAPKEEIWRFHGYGTLGVAHSSEDSADYVAAPMKSEGPGKTRKWDPYLDSVIALQADARFNSEWSAVIQGVVERQFDQEVEPDLEWANVRYDVTPWVSIRAGRIALSTFMVSDYRKVGHSYPWVRPPAELYQLYGLTNSDGVDLIYRNSYGDVYHTAGMLYGRNEMEELDGALQSPNMWSVYNRLEKGPWALHTSYTSTKLEYGDELNLLWDAYDRFGPPGEAVSDRYDGNGKWAEFMAVGLQYDPGNWFVMGEWGMGDRQTAFDQRSAWYVSGGYRIGNVTPYATYARANGDHVEADGGLNPSRYPPEAAATARILNGFLDLSQNFTTPRQDTISVGVRWDVRPNISLKAQYDYVTPRDGSIGLFQNFGDFESGAPPTSFAPPPDEADVVSLSVNFVF